MEQIAGIPMRKELFYINSAAPTITGCMIHSNNAARNGIGIVGGSSPVISDTTISGMIEERNLYKWRFQPDGERLHDNGQRHRDTH